MPEARDRIERPVDYPAAFLNRRSNGILIDEPAATHHHLFGSPVQRVPSEATGLGSIGQGSLMGRDGLVRGNFGIRRTAGGGRRGQIQFRSPQGRENTSLGVTRRGRARASTSVLPSWYPRTPLRDVSAVVRAIERRRARMGEGVGRDIETPTPQQLGVLDSLVPLSGAQLEHDYSMVTPGPSVGFKRPWPPSTAKVHQILLDITRENTGEEDALTPQKKLLNSIDKVEKVVMEEIQKMKSTPSAKRAEREKRVRTLMSMR
ncbi:PREDICTED: protein POLYCHOME [Camelina sativa]|uniref:Protein POLYCHOME n=1 Tax=Camelina sativa TaxID=90675 RepID=A0ABM0YUG1_CAMSA|nr:PREDICTED: protein POLYCHOME [Camelina sativa]XP_010506039.1 PREDICTED: protein POLYCHOME [Camelina sativa]